VIKALEPVILFSVNAEDSLGAPLARAHVVSAYPTWLLLNAQGGIVDRWLGYEKTSFIETLAEVLRDPATIDQKLARFKAQPTERDALTLARYHAARDDIAEAVRLFREAQRLNTDPKANLSGQVFRLVAAGVRDSLFTEDELRSAADEVLASPKCTAGEVLLMASMLQQLGAERGDRTLGARQVQLALEATAAETDPDTQRQRAAVLADYTLHSLHQPEQALAHRRAAMPMGWLESAAELNEFCWWCFEAATNLEEAEQLARKAAGLAQPGTEKAMVLDTLAEIVNARGNAKEALALSEQAASEDPKSDYYPKQVVRFKQAAGVS
jgi:tetratricopeptide (TPR) repeat protein